MPIVYVLANLYEELHKIPHSVLKDDRMAIIIPIFFFDEGKADFSSFHSMEKSLLLYDKLVYKVI